MLWTQDSTEEKRVKLPNHTCCERAGQKKRKCKEITSCWSDGREKKNKAQMDFKIQPKREISKGTYFLQGSTVLGEADA